MSKNNERGSYESSGNRISNTSYDLASGGSTLQKMPTGASGPDKQGRHSLFNRYNYFSWDPEGDGNSPADYFDSGVNIGRVVTTGDRNKESSIHPARVPSASNIISKNKGRNAAVYDWVDFLYCTDYGAVPNNYMITLRRFGDPVEDNILSKDMVPSPDIARLVTWMDGENNKLDDIMSWSMGVTWDELQSEVQTLDANKAGYGTMMPGMIANATDTSGNVQRHNLEGEQNLNFDPVENYKNRIYGPIDVVDRIMRRGRGLNFEQNITVKFDYELKSIDGINGKVAMLDLLGNIFVATYSKGEFWGGETRWHGAGKKHKPMGDPDLLKNGNYVGYLKSLVEGTFGKLDALAGGADVFSFEGLKNIAKTIGGNLLSGIAGGALNKMGRPEIQAIHALLTGEATGEWHLTIGNPLNPIAFMGNLILEDTNVTMHGPLSIDDFPTRITVECTLKHARPRDKGDLESMFNLGRGRLYGSALDLIAKDYYLNVDRSKNKGGDPKANGKSLPRETIDRNLAEIGRFPNYYDKVGNVIRAAKHTT